MRNNGEEIILKGYYTNLEQKKTASERTPGNNKYRLKNWLPRALPKPCKSSKPKKIGDPRADHINRLELM